MIIFNEKKYVEETILNQRHKINNMREIVMLCRYCQRQGLDVNQSQSVVMGKLKIGSYEHSICEDEFYFKNIFENAKSRQLRENEPVFISEEELNTVIEINDINKQRLLFCLLVICKYLKTTVLDISYSELKKHSGFVGDNNKMLKELMWLDKNGYINVHKVGKYTVKFIKLDVTDGYEVRNYNNIPSILYEKMRTNTHFHCLNCGKKVMFKRNTQKTKYSKDELRMDKARKYCDKCAKIRHKSEFSSDFYKKKSSNPPIITS